MSRGLKPDFLAALNAEAEASAYLRGKAKTALVGVLGDLWRDSHISEARPFDRLRASCGALVVGHPIWWRKGVSGWGGVGGMAGPSTA
jgi:hypothetical protein